MSICWIKALPVTAPGPYAVATRQRVVRRSLALTATILKQIPRSLKMSRRVVLQTRVCGIWEVTLMGEFLDWFAVERAKCTEYKNYFMTLVFHQNWFA
jgi:hypothetical protein